MASNGRDFVLVGEMSPKIIMWAVVSLLMENLRRLWRVMGQMLNLNTHPPLGMEGKPYQIRLGCGRIRRIVSKFSNFDRYGGFLSVRQNQVRV